MNGDELKIRISGVPPNMKREEIIEWLSWYGTVKSDLKVKKIRGNDELLNVDGLVDRTTIDVIMELERDFREKEIVEDMVINVSYFNMPKTCWNCKKPGSECESGGGQGYLCRMKRKEVSWDEAYDKEDEEKERQWKHVEERISASEAYDFEEEEFYVERDKESYKDNHSIPEGFKIAGIRIRGKGKLTKETCNELISDLVENMKNEGKEIKEALENGEVIEG